MTEVVDSTQAPRSLASDMPNYPEQTPSNDSRDEVQKSSDVHHEIIDHRETDHNNDLNSFQTPSHSNNPEEIINGDAHQASDQQEVQRRQSDAVNEIQSGSGDATNVSRRSVTSNHLHDDQIENVNAVTNESITDDLVHPMNESDSVHNYSSTTEQRVTSAVQNNGHVSNDGHYHQTEVATTVVDESREHQVEEENEQKYASGGNASQANAEIIGDEQRSVSPTRENELDETIRFQATTSQQSSRPPSIASKRSIHDIADETKVSTNDKQTPVIPSGLATEGTTDGDINNQEEENVIRRASSPTAAGNRSPSPTTSESQKHSMSIDQVKSLFIEQTDSTTHETVADSKTHRRTFSSTSNTNQLVSPAIVHDSSDDAEQQKESSRPSSAVRSIANNNQFTTTTSQPESHHADRENETDDFESLIKVGERLQIPSDDLIDQRLESPPPSASSANEMLSTDELLEKGHVQKPQEQSRPPSELNRTSPTKSLVDNEQFYDQVPVVHAKQDNNDNDQEKTSIHEKPVSRRGSKIIELVQRVIDSRRSSTSQHRDEFDSHQEQQPVSRRESTELEKQPTSRKASITSEQQPVNGKRISITSEHKSESRRVSAAHEQAPSSKRGSTTIEQKIASRKGSNASEHAASIKRESVSSDKQSTSRQGGAVEQKPTSRKTSDASEHAGLIKRDSITSEKQIEGRRESAKNESKASSKRGSTTIEQKVASRKGSNVSDHATFIKRESVSSEKQTPTSPESHADHHITTLRQESTAFEYEPSKKRGSQSSEQQTFTHQKGHVSERQSADRRSSTDAQQEQHVLSVSASRKSSINEQPQIASRRESQHKTSASHSNATTKEEYQRETTLARKDSRVSSTRSKDSGDSRVKHEHNGLKSDAQSSDTEVSTRISSKPRQARSSSGDKRQKLSSLLDDTSQSKPSSTQRRSGQQSKRNSQIASDETIVTPIIMDSFNTRQHSGNRSAKADSDKENALKSKLPPVNSALQPKTHRSETSGRQQVLISNRSDRKSRSSSSSSSSAASGSPTKMHWTKQMPVIPIGFDELDTQPLSYEEITRPKSPNAEQIAEHNITAVGATKPKKTTGKKRVTTEKDEQKRKDQYGLSRRSTSVESANHIPLVDDESLDSASDNDLEYEESQQRRIKPKKRDVETNTERIYDSEQQESYFDERELHPQKPLKATQPLTDHLHSTRRRAQNKEHILATPDTMSNNGTPTIRRVVKSKDHDQDKEPVNVNVTVVVKKFTGPSEDGNVRTTITEAHVEQKPEPYFEPVEHPPISSTPQQPAPTTEDIAKSEERIERPFSTEQQPTKPLEKATEHMDRQIYSDTEQVVADKQKKQRRPKRISRTCQTYECVFRRMEREQQQELRTISDNEKNIQTIKSQLRPRKRSPKKNPPLYLSADSFRVEELLPKPYHQSRRNLSKSSAIARSLSPQGGKLLILRPTLPFHHSDAVSVQRVCLQYAIDLIPNENTLQGAMSAPRHRANVYKQPEPSNTLPMISSSSSASNVPLSKSNPKEKSASHKSDDYTHQRKTGGGV